MTDAAVCAQIVAVMMTGAVVVMILVATKTAVTEEILIVVMMDVTKRACLQVLRLVFST